MDGQKGEHELREEEAAARRQRDRDDFDNEIAGNETGRMRRFLREDQTPQAAQLREQERERRARTALVTQIQLQQFSARLEELDRASLGALRASERQARDAGERLDRLRESANRDEHGQRVYRTEDGRAAYYDDGTQLRRNEMDRVDWKAGTPTWEQRQGVGRALDHANAERDAIKNYRDRIAHAKDRVAAGDDLDEDELKALQAGAEDMPASVRNQLNAQAPARTSAAAQYQDGRKVTDAPQTAQAFNEASAAVSEAPTPRERQTAKPETAPAPVR
jgi:hypothetical protein